MTAGVRRTTDGSAGDADYGVIGEDYARFRRPDPRFVAAIEAALGDARTLINVGAGAGSYEPTTLVLVLTCDPAELHRCWLHDYAPEVIETEASRYPAIDTIAAGLGGTVDVEHLPIPLDCTDRFSEAYYGRPEGLLDPGARRANSAWSFVDPAVATRFEEHLRRDLDSGAWDARYGHLRTRPTFDGSLRLLVSRA